MKTKALSIVLSVLMFFTVALPVNIWAEDNDTSDYVEEQTAEVVEETEITDELEDVQNETEVSVTDEETDELNETVPGESEEIMVTDDENSAEEVIIETDAEDKNEVTDVAAEEVEEVNVALTNVQISAYQDDEGNIYIEADNPEFLRELASSDYYGDSEIEFNDYHGDFSWLSNYEYYRDFELVNNTDGIYILIPWYSVKSNLIKEGSTYKISFHGPFASKYNYNEVELYIKFGSLPLPNDIEAYQDDNGDLVIKTSDSKYLDSLAMDYDSIDRLPNFSHCTSMFLDDEVNDEYYYIQSYTYNQRVKRDLENGCVRLTYQGIKSLGIPAGTYTLGLRPLGYETFIIENFELTKGASIAEGLEIYQNDKLELVIKSSDTEWLNALADSGNINFYDCYGDYVGRVETYNLKVVNGSITIPYERVANSKVEDGTYRLRITAYNFGEVKVEEFEFESGVLEAPEVYVTQDDKYVYFIADGENVNEWADMIVKGSVDSYSKNDYSYITYGEISARAYTGSDSYGGGISNYTYIYNGKTQYTYKKLEKYKYGLRIEKSELLSKNFRDADYEFTFSAMGFKDTTASEWLDLGEELIPNMVSELYLYGDFTPIVGQSTEIAEGSYRITGLNSDGEWVDISDSCSVFWTEEIDAGYDILHDRTQDKTFKDGKTYYLKISYDYIESREDSETIYLYYGDQEIESTREFFGVAGGGTYLWIYDYKDFIIPFTPVKTKTVYIEYELNGGDFVKDPVTEFNYATSGSVTLPVPVREGYEFGGWYTNPEFTGTALKSVSKKNSVGYYLYAKWNKNPYVIKFDSNGGTGKMANIVVNDYENTVYLPDSKDVTISRPGYVFYGWSDSKDGDIVDFEFSYVPEQSNETVTLYAAWELREYYIDFDVPEDAYLVNEEEEWPEQYYSNCYTINDKFTLPTLAMSGYRFDGWYLNDKKVTSISGSYGNICLEARFTPITFAISYNANGGTIDKKVKYDTVYSIATEELSFPSVSKTGYEFDGWYADKELNDRVDTKEDLLDLVGYAKVTLYAGYNEILPESVSITGINTLMEGKSTVLKAEVNPDNALKKAIKWESLNTDILTVNSSGKVSARKTDKAVTAKVKACVVDHPEVCNTMDITVTPSVKSVTIHDEQGNVTTNKTVINIDPEDTSVYKLSAATLPTDAMDDIVWSSNNKNVTVDNDGTVHINTAKAKVKITAKANDGSNKSTYVTLNIAKLVKSVKIDETTKPLNDVLTQGKSVTLKASVNPVDAADKALIWTSSDTSVASVSNGKVTAKKVDKATEVTISVKARGGNEEAYDSYSFIVLPLASSVSIKNDDNEVIDKKLIGIDPDVTQSYKLNVVSYPEDAADSFSFKSSNSKVATVDDKGNVSFLSNGKVTITVTANDGSKKSSSVTFNVAKLVKSITLSGPEEVASTKYITLKAKVNPTDAANRKLKWESSDTSIATVSSSGKVSAKKLNEIKTVTIRAYAQDGSNVVSNAWEITVVPLVASVSINDGSDTVDKKTLSIDYIENEFYQLYATTYPEDASDKVTWKSSNTKVATVDEDGLVSFIGKGKVTITATATDGSKKSSSVTFNSSRLVSEINVTYPQYMYKGKTSKIYTDIYPEDAANKSLKFTSDNPSVVKVDSKGKLTAVAEGTATVTVSTTDGSGVYNSFDIEVVPFENQAKVLYDYIRDYGKPAYGDSKELENTIRYDGNYFQYMVYTEGPELLSLSINYQAEDYYYQMSILYNINTQKIINSIYFNNPVGFSLGYRDGIGYFDSGFKLNAQDITSDGYYKFGKIKKTGTIPVSNTELNEIANEMLYYGLSYLDDLVRESGVNGLYDIGFYSLLFQD